MRDWLGGTTRAIVSEETLALGSYGRVLTVLTSRTLGQEDESDEDADDEEALVKSWTPRFRR